MVKSSFIFSLSKYFIKSKTPQYFEQFGELDYVCTLLLKLKDFLLKNVFKFDSFQKSAQF